MSELPPETPRTTRTYGFRDNMRLFTSRRVLRWLPPLFVVCFALALVLPDSAKVVVLLPAVTVLSVALTNEQKSRNSSSEE